MLEYIGGRHERILSIFNQLIEGNGIKVNDAAQHFNVSTKTIKRDIDDIRNFFSESHISGEDREVVYNRRANEYRLVGSKKLTGKEIFAICKVLFESKPFCKKEFMPIIEKLVSKCTYNNDLTHVKNMIANEKYHYTGPKHEKNVIDSVWDISYAIHNHKQILIQYTRLTEPKHRERIINPVGIMFSDFYFYLAAFIPEKNTKNPTIYRIDRLSDYKILDSGFYVPYSNRFEEGEFRKRIQFMYGGDLLRFEFNYYGESPEAIQDRLPTAEIVEKGNGVIRFRAEVFGRGIKPWLLSQADKIEVTKPADFREEMKDLISKIYNMYC